MMLSILDLAIDILQKLTTSLKVQLKYQFIFHWKSNTVMMETFINILLPYYMDVGRGFPNNSA